MLVPKKWSNIVQAKENTSMGQIWSVGHCFANRDEISKNSAVKVSLAAHMWKSKAWPWSYGPRVLERAVACVLQALTVLLAHWPWGQVDVAFTAFYSEGRQYCHITCSWLDHCPGCGAVMWKPWFVSCREWFMNSRRHWAGCSYVASWPFKVCEGRSG